jgi:ABC-2 type transport system permease protein
MPDNIINKSYRFIDDHIIHIGAILLIIPPILCLLYIWKYGFNVIYWDEWEFVPYFQHFFMGQLTFSDLFSLHNEHRIFFPRIIFLVDAVLFHYYTKYISYLSWLSLVIILFMLYRMFASYVKNKKLAVIELIPVAFILFTFKQWESILFGLTICSYLSVFGFIAAIYLLDKTDRINFTFLSAILFGVISTYSYSIGLLTWPLGLLFLLISKTQNRSRLSIGWSLVGVLAISVYFYGFHLNPAHPSVLYPMAHPDMAIEFLLVNISSLFAFTVNSGLVIGGILFVLLTAVFVIILKNNLVKKYSLPIILILFSLGSTGLLLIGRSGFGVDAGLTSRYIHYTLFTVIGLYLILVDLLNNKTYNQKLNKAMFIVLISMIAYGVIAGYAIGIQKGENVKKTNDVDRYILVNYKSMADDQLERLYPNADVLKERIKIAEQYRLNVFYDNSTVAR